jgi:hypothetical protein
MIDDVAAVRLEGLVEALDGPARVAAAEGELPEPLEGAAAQARVLGRAERLLEERAGGVEVVEAQRELGLGEEIVLAPDPFGARCQELARYPEPLAEELEHLERRRAHARLDPGDVGRRAAGKRQLALAQADFLACALDALAYGTWVVDMCCLFPRQVASRSIYSAGLRARDRFCTSDKERNDPDEDAACHSLCRSWVDRRACRRHALGLGLLRSRGVGAARPSRRLCARTKDAPDPSSGDYDGF